jgi:hypothetical protein
MPFHFKKVAVHHHEGSTEVSKLSTRGGSITAKFISSYYTHMCDAYVKRHKTLEEKDSFH